MTIIDKEKLKQELAAIGATFPTDATVAGKIGEVIVAVFSHTAKRTAAALAAASKRQESADLLIADLDRRIADLEERSRVTP